MSQQKKNSREKEHAEMLEAALARPGVREMMEVYSNWQKKDCSLDPYRSVTETYEKTTTTNSSNLADQA